jgi:hypothetical protein
MEQTLQILNELERAGVLGRYAIGGAMGATFYVEPVLTYDLDVFVVLPQTPGGLLTLAPLYQALRKRGYTEEGDCVNIAGVPVQFLPAYNVKSKQCAFYAIFGFFAVKSRLSEPNRSAQNHLGMASFCPTRRLFASVMPLASIKTLSLTL